MSLPIFQTDSKDLGLLQTRWAQEINPVLRSPLSNGLLLTGIHLVTGDNVVNHLLDRRLQGWILTGTTAASSIYDKQAANQMTNKTLVLNSSAPTTISLWVF